MSDTSGNRSEPRAAVAQPPSPSAAIPTTGKRIRSADLLAGAREVLIDHSGETYRLRHTNQGKLILTK